MEVEFTDDVLNFIYKFKFDNPIYCMDDWQDGQERNKKELIDENNYGIILAKMVGFKEEIINNAKSLSTKFRNKTIYDYLYSSKNILVIIIFLNLVFEIAYVRVTKNR